MRSQRAVANRAARSRQLASHVTGAARRAERSLCASERSSQQSDGAAKRAQTPLRALACFAPASPCTQTRAWFYAGELLFWPLECSIISEHPPNPSLQPTASRRDRRHFGWWYHALSLIGVYCTQIVGNKMKGSTGNAAQSTDRRQYCTSC